MGKATKFVTQQRVIKLDSSLHRIYNVITGVGMKSRIIRIGNSQGVRIPKVLLQEAGLSDDVEVTVEGSTITIRSATATRGGWDTAFQKMAEQGDDQLLDARAPTSFDEDEWEWA